MRNLDCDYPGENLSAYIDGELDDHQRRDVCAHLDGCTRCRDRLEHLRETRAFLSSAPSYDLPPDFHRNLRAELLRKKAEQKRAAPLAWFPTGVYVAALLALLIILPLSALRTFHGASPDMMSATEDSIQPEAESPFVSMQEEAEEEAEPPTLASAPVSGLRTEQMRLQVTDVQGWTEFLIDAATAEGAQVREQEFTWGSDGSLLEATLVFELTAAEVSSIREQLVQLGDLTLHRADRLDPPPGEVSAELEGDTDASQVVMRVTLFAGPHPGEDKYEMPQASVYAGRDGPLAQQLRVALTDSWVRFGAHIHLSILWVAGHVPHLFFVGALIALTFLTVSRARRPR